MSILPRFLAIAVLALAGHLPAALGDALPYSQGVLWKVEKGGAASHVFGTIHSVDKRVLTLPDPVAHAFEESSSFTLEIATDEWTPKKLAILMRLPEDRELEAVVGPELFEDIVEAGSRYGIPSENLELLKPWALLSLFGIPPSEFSRGQEGELALDNWLQKQALDRPIPVYGLETVEEQAEIFNGMSEADQVMLLGKAVADNATIDVWYEQLLQDYLARDLAALHAMTTESVPKDDERLFRLLQRRLVIDRNHRMVAQMLKRLGQGGAFIAVGALHLPGEEGILNLLKQRGFEISRVY